MLALGCAVNHGRKPKDLLWVGGGQKEPNQPPIKKSASVTAITSMNTPFLHTAIKD